MLERRVQKIGTVVYQVQAVSDIELLPHGVASESIALKRQALRLGHRLFVNSGFFLLMPAHSPYMGMDVGFVLLNLRKVSNQSSKVGFKVFNVTLNKFGTVHRVFEHLDEVLDGLVGATDGGIALGKASRCLFRLTLDCHQQFR